MDLREEMVDPALATRLPLPFARRHKLLPFRMQGGAVEVLTADPYALDALDDCRRLLGQPVVPLPVDESTLLSLLDRLYDKAGRSAAEVVEDLEAVSLEDLPVEPADLLEVASDAPVIRLVNAILSEACMRKASDIHIEPYERKLLVRFRVDGVLHTVLEPPRAAASSLVSRIKVMAALDIAEKRRPQDGRIKIRVAGREVDIRLSVLPTAYGERLVMRLLDRGEALLDLEATGLEGDDRAAFERLIHLPHGMVLVTGPTGSGKTTTLYAALSAIRSASCNILTIEDPIEYELPGVGQMQVNPKTGLTFAAGLRSILRQDPDVIMVGEIRDLEAARIAVQAALTGHLVFSTLHTNDAPSACTRLADIGVEPFLLASALSGVVAQRLVRVLCPRCRLPYTPAEERRVLALDADVLYRPQGCEHCMGTGYRGRTGIYELLEVDEEVARLIRTGAPEEALRKKLASSLREAGFRKAASGITSVEEVLRVTD